MSDKLFAAFLSIGGFASLGALLDSALYASDRSKLKATLEDWWLVFTDATWANFSVKEAKWAIDWLDQHAGRELWSLQRWRFSAQVACVVWMLSFAFTVVQAGIAMLYGNANLNFDSEHISYVAVTKAIVTQLAFVIVAFSISLSLTRFIARVVERSSTNRLTAVVSFIALLWIHLLLFYLWSSVVLGVVLAVVDWTSAVFVFRTIPVSAGDWYRQTIYLIEQGAHKFDLEYAWSDVFWPHFAKEVNISSLTVKRDAYYKFAMDIVSNGARIAFSMLFLAAFLARPLHLRLGAIFYNGINSSKPPLTMVFGTLGAAIAFVGTLLS